MLVYLLTEKLQQSKAGVWGTVSQAPKISLLDIQEKQQKVASPVPSGISASTLALAPAPAATPLPKLATASVQEDDFWGGSETPTVKTAKTAVGKAGSVAVAPALTDDNHFPALGGASKPSASNPVAKKPSTPPAGQHQKKGSGGQPNNWGQKSTGTGQPGGRGKLSSSSGSNQQHISAGSAPPSTISARQPSGKAGLSNAAGGKKKMQKLDPSLLGFSSNLQDRIAQGQVLPVDE